MERQTNRPKCISLARLCRSEADKLTPFMINKWPSLVPLWKSATKVNWPLGASKYPWFTFSAKTAWRSWLRRTRAFVHHVQSVTARHRCSGDNDGCSICDSAITRTSSTSWSNSEPKRRCQQTNVWMSKYNRQLGTVETIAHYSIAVVLGGGGYVKPHHGVHEERASDKNVTLKWIMFTKTVSVWYFEFVVLYKLHVPM